MLQAFQGRPSNSIRAVRDVGRFAMAAIRSPKAVGAVIPSSGWSAKAMVSASKPNRETKLLELGAGTGVFTRAFMSAGVQQQNMTILELDEHLLKPLQIIAPDANVVAADAFSEVPKWVEEGHRYDIVVSAIPFLNLPKDKSLAMRDCLAKSLDQGGCIVQITYGNNSPIPLEQPGLTALRGYKTHRIWRNVPPCTIWRYEVA